MLLLSAVLMLVNAVRTPLATLFMPAVAANAKSATTREYSTMSWPFWLLMRACSLCKIERS